jgi:hypothetical protein
MVSKNKSLSPRHWHRRRRRRRHHHHHHHHHQEVRSRSLSSMRLIVKELFWVLPFIHPADMIEPCLLLLSGFIFDLVYFYL